MSMFKVGDRVRATTWAAPSVGFICEVGEDDYTVRLESKQKPKHAAFARDGVYYIYQSDSGMELLSHPKILITTDGKTTLARLYEGEKVVKRAEAKCAPGDEFRFEIGANLAFDRLMGRVGMLPKPEQPKQDKPEPEQEKRQYKAGDTVRYTGLCAACEGATAKLVKYVGGIFATWEVDNKEKPPHNKWPEINMELVKHAEQDKPEPEQPQYFTGKVVCVEISSPQMNQYWTPGSVYQFEDGRGHNNTGAETPTNGTHIESFSHLVEHYKLGAKFIEFKGENAH